MKAVLIFFFVTFIGFTNCENSELLSVVIIYRHGCRAPIELYKNDPYQKIASEIWPDGLQQLTNIGKNQHFELGKWLRNRYKNFIPENYNHNFILVQSSGIDRCLQSAASNLAGLFPPKDRQIWKKEIQWQPIPIHTTPPHEDNLMAMMQPCAKHSKLFKDLFQSKELKLFMKKMENTVRYIQKHSGEVCDFEKVADIHDTLFSEAYSGLVLPEWTHKIYPNNTESFFIMYNKFFVYTPPLERLKSGPLVDYITTFFEKVLTKPNPRKFLMLSGHDFTLIFLLKALGLYDDSWPEYASSVILELRSRNHEEFVNVYFKNSTGIQKLSLNLCGIDCNFSTFKEITKRVRVKPEDWQKECSNV